MIFHKKLGSIFQKTHRTILLIDSLAEAVKISGIKEACQRAALLSKADLTTGMVGEFPSLQGLIGKEYATHDGELAEVCMALGEYYQPRTPAHDIPQRNLGKEIS